MAKLIRLANFEGYPKECMHSDNKSCQGDLLPYKGEQDSFGYEVIGLCSHHANMVRDNVESCDSCGTPHRSLVYSVPMQMMVCPSCKTTEW